MAVPLADSLWQLFRLAFPPFVFFGNRAFIRSLFRFKNGGDPVTVKHSSMCDGLAWFFAGFVYFGAVIDGPVSAPLLLIIPAWAAALVIYYSRKNRNLRENS